MALPDICVAICTHFLYRAREGTGPGSDWQGCRSATGRWAPLNGLHFRAVGPPWDMNGPPQRQETADGPLIILLTQSDPGQDTAASMHMGTVFPRAKKLIAREEKRF